MKFRPIVAGPVCPTSRLSHIIDEIIKPLVPQTTSYIRDDIDFLTKIERELPNGDQCQLVSFDVESLYTTIDHDLGIEAVKYWVEKKGDMLPGRFTCAFICDAINIILKNNVFFFNDQYYEQINGTAMGTKVAPSYANLTMAFLEENMYEKCLDKYDEPVANYIKDQWKRYLDDCYILWKSSGGDLQQFHDLLQGLHPKIRFTRESSEEQLPFLDILMKAKSNEITTSVYYKPTDSHQYFTFNSCHPRHTKLNIPYSQARRLCTIIDDKDELNSRLTEMSNFFSERGYPAGIIKMGIEKAKSISQAELRRTREKTVDENVIAMVTTHNPTNPEIQDVINTALGILNSDEKMHNIFKNTKIIRSRRQPPNLKHILTRARFDGGEEQINGVFKCKEPRCGNCTYIKECTEIKFKNSGKPFQIRSKLSCTTENVIYLMICNGCSGEYIGETSLQLRRRMTLHRQHIRDPSVRKLNVSAHIDRCAHNLDIKFQVIPFYKVKTSNAIDRKSMELHFIDRLKPNLNSVK